jgi:ribosomal protein L12E/L44/L45/RPP1/RPP2
MSAHQIGGNMKMENVRIKYIRDAKRNPVGCVAWAGSAKDKTLYLGVSSHNPEDVFKKEVARSIAMGRLLQRMTSGQASSRVFSEESLTEVLLCAVNKDPHASTRVKKASERELKVITKNAATKPATSTKAPSKKAPARKIAKKSASSDKTKS